MTERQNYNLGDLMRRMESLEIKLNYICRLLEQMQGGSHSVTIGSASAVSSPLQAVTLKPDQVQAAQDFFRDVQKVGREKIGAEMNEQLALLHFAFANTTECEAWSREWDDIIDQAQEKVSQGKDTVVGFVREELERRGFPGWAVQALSGAVSMILKLGEAELSAGLELARKAGKLGLFLRCKLLPFG